VSVYKINGHQVTQEQFLAHKPGDPIPQMPPEEQVGPMVNRAWEKEFHSETLAENPKNLKWLKQLDEQLGVGDTKYDPEGRPVFTSKRKWDLYKKAHGYHDRGVVRGKKLTNEIDGSILKRLMERFKCN
jgi:hypothetical protein